MADPSKYTTVEGDVPDLIVWRTRQQTAELTEQLFDLNPGLSFHGPNLPPGLVVTLPARPTKKPERNVPRIWS